jgi:hypothetical protein
MRYASKRAIGVKEMVKSREIVHVTIGSLIVTVEMQTLLFD